MMKRIFFILVSIVLMSASAVAQTANAQAQEYFEMGTQYLDSKDLKRGQEYLLKAARLNHTKAMWRLVCLYSHKLGGAYNPTQGLTWAKKLSTVLKNLESIGLVPGELEYKIYGLLPASDKVSRFNYAQKAAQKGYKGAYATLGLLYWSGEGCPRNYDKAFFYASKAAKELENTAALLEQDICNLVLADLYGNGLGTKKDLKQALYYSNKIIEGRHKDHDKWEIEYCATSGSAREQLDLFNKYKSKDQPKALAFAQKLTSVKSKDPQAWYLTALCQTEDIGCKGQKPAAISSFAKAIAYGSDDALRYVKQNSSLMPDVLREMERTNINNAMVQYIKGVGMLKDEASMGGNIYEGIRMLKQLHQGGDSKATKALTDFASSYGMTLDQLLAKELPNNVQPSSDEAVDVAAWTMPVFPGGSRGLFDFLRRNIVYPPTCEEHNITGRAIVKMIVDKQGNVTEVEIVKSAGHIMLDKEAKRVVSKLPKWAPGIDKGHYVRTKYNIPITFSM